MQLYSSTTVMELFENKFITRKVQTICRKAKLLTIADIVAYYKSNHNFLSIDYCGKVMNSQLINVCQKFEEEGAERLEEEDGPTTWESSHIELEEEGSTEPLVFATQGALSWELAELRYLKLLSRLSRRAKNKLIACCNGATLTDLLLTVNEKHTYRIQQLLNSALLSGIEINAFLCDVGDILPGTPSSANMADMDLHLLCNKLSAMVGGTTTDEMGRFIESNFHHFTTGHFPLWEFAHIFLHNCEGTHEKRKQIFLRVTNWYASNVHTNITAVAQQYGYKSKESVLKVLYVEKADEELLHLLEQAIAILQSFQLCLPSSFVLPKEDFLLRRYDDLIEQTPFTNSFAVLFMAIVNPHYKAICIRTDKNKQWFLLAKHIHEQFDVVSFSDAVRKLLAKEFIEEKIISFARLVAPFIGQKVKPNEHEPLIKLAASLLNNLYGISPDADGYLHLKRTTHKRTWEYVYEVLEEQNKLCSKDKIIELLAAKGIIISRRNIALAIGNTRFFISVGKTLHGLKEWEESGREQSGGIKHIVKKYLEEQDEPKHILDITRWVMRYRNTNARNIQQNIQNDALHWFKFFGSGYYGLATKQYNVPEFRNFDGAALNYLKHLFKEENKDRLSTKEVIRHIIEKYGVQPVQAEYLLYRHIASGIFREEEEYLVLVSR